MTADPWVPRGYLRISGFYFQLARCGPMPADLRIFPACAKNGVSVFKLLKCVMASGNQLDGGDRKGQDKSRCSG